ncbi:MAG: hypothetical protein ABL956_11735 [Hyphomonadaceae bacterium]
MDDTVMLWLVGAPAVIVVMMLVAAPVARSLDASRSISKVEAAALVKAFGEKLETSKAETGADSQADRQKKQTRTLMGIIGAVVLVVSTSDGFGK